MDREKLSEPGPDGLTFGQRIEQERERLGMDQSAFKVAVMGGKPRPSTVIQWEKDRSVPPASTLLSMCELFDVSADWLMTGKGPRKRDPLEDEKRVRLIAEIATGGLRPDEVLGLLEKGRRGADRHGLNNGNGDNGAPPD